MQITDPSQCSAMAAEMTYPREFLLVARTMTVSTLASKLAHEMPTTMTETDRLLWKEPVPGQQASEENLDSVPTTAAGENGRASPPMQAPSLSPALQRQAPSVMLSLESSLPPAWDAQAPMSPVPSSPSVQAALSTPMSSPPSMPAWHHSLWPASPAHFSPMSWPASPAPTSLPPMLPSWIPAAGSPSSEQAPPSWDAWSVEPCTKKPGTTPTSFSGSESESTTGPPGLSLDEHVLHASASETDSLADYINETTSTCATPSANGQCELGASTPPHPIEPLSLKFPHTPQKKLSQALCLDSLL